MSNKEKNKKLSYSEDKDEIIIPPGDDGYGDDEEATIKI